jgi:hypothetical protein
MKLIAYRANAGACALRAPAQRCKTWNDVMASGNFVAYYSVSTAEQGRSGLGLDGPTSMADAGN